MATRVPMFALLQGLEQHLQNRMEKLAQAEAEHLATESENGAMQTRILALESELEASKTELAASQAHAQALELERDSLKEKGRDYQNGAFVRSGVGGRPRSGVGEHLFRVDWGAKRDTQTPSSSPHPASATSLFS